MLVLLGFESVLFQATILRELACLFRSNEIVLGVLFFWWFLGAGVGSAFFRFLAFKIKGGIFHESSILIAASLLFTILIFLIRICNGIFLYQAEPDLILLTLISAFLILPLSFLIGAAFPALSSITPSRRTTFSYFMETSGFFAGGIIYSFLVAGNFDSLLIAFFSVLVSCSLALPLALKERKKGYSILLSMLILIDIFFIAGNGFFCDLSRFLQWNGHPSESLDSRLGNITLLDHNGMATLYYNGRIIATDPPELTVEETAHVPGLLCNDMKNILIIGWAQQGLIREFLKYQPERLINVFIDEKMGPLSRKYFEGDRRVALIPLDPSVWLKTAGKKFDLIMINIPMPDTLYESRYYQDSFFYSLRRILSAGGMIVFPLSYEENSLLPETAMSLRIIYNKMKKYYPYVEMLPMEYFYIFASGSKILCSSDILENKILEKGKDLALLKLNSGYIHAYLNEKRVLDITDKVNRMDIRASSLDLLDFRIYSNTLKKWLRMSLQDKWLALAVLLFLMAYFIRRKRRFLKNLFNPSVEGVLLFFTAFCGIGGELMLIYLYQFLFGYIYTDFALLTSVFMAGMSLGSGWVVFYNFRYNKGRILFFLMPVWPAMIGIFFYCWRFLEGSAGILIFLLLFAGGFLNGAVFNRIAGEMEKSSDAYVVAAKTYSYDLYGSACGAMLSATLLFPFLGFTMSVMVMIAMLLFISIFIYKRSGKYSRSGLKV